MKTNDIEMRHPRGEFVPVRKLGACANWFNPVYVKVRKLPKVKKPIVVNVEKFIGRIVL
jgi:hypothetical protein